MLRPERLLAARTLLGVTQAELASAAGVTQALVSQIESHRKDFTAVSGERFADALALPIEFFSREPSFPVDTLQFRKRASVSLKSTARAQALFVEGFRVTEELLDESDYPRQTLPVITDQDDVLSPARIDEIAAEAREALGLAATGPVTNVIRTLERGGVAVSPIVIPEANLDGHDGVSATAGRGQAALVGYVPSAGDRQRFSIAHELGHLVLHSRRRSQDPEKEAHLFAGAFLLPRDRARELITPTATLNVLARVKAEWGVSVAALVKRGEAVGTLDRDRVQTLYRQINNRGWRRQEPVEVGLESPRLLYRLMQRKFGDAPYGSSAIVHSLALPMMSLRSLVPPPPQAPTARTAASNVTRFRQQ